MSSRLIPTNGTKRPSVFSKRTAAMMAARYAVQNNLPLNINFIWELEEEIGSPSFEHFVSSNLERLKSDSILVSDTIWISRERPAIPYGLRGAMMFTMTLETGS